MIHAYLGDIRIGDAVWTGPTAATESRKATLVEHKVARGKPPIQDMGDENDTKTLKFLFDETFCDPGAELGKLQGVFAARSPLAYVAGDGSFNGVRWLIEDLGVTTLKTTPYGRPVRIEVEAKLKECPGLSPLSFFMAAARMAASAIASSANINVSVKW